MAIKNFIEELEWRGMIHTIMPGAKEQLEKEMTTAYLGIDPTADSLHIGHLVGVMILKHFQMCGHRPIALVGGATGMIGDPSGKSQERNLLDETTLRHNQDAIKRQLSKLIDFDSARLIKPCYPNDTEYLGTVGYAAPEQYGEVQTDTRADIYSMGILMNELLTKKRPSELLYPGKLQKVIVKCIQVSPDKRFQTAEKLKRSLHG